MCLCSQVCTIPDRMQVCIYSGGFRGGKAVRGVQMHPPLAASNVFCVYITARVHQMIMQQWHAATTPGTVTHSRISSLLISRRLTRPRVASRYSVRPEGPPRRASAYEISKSTGFHVDFGFRVDFWISVWISADTFLLVCSRVF